MADSNSPRDRPVHHIVSALVEAMTEPDGVSRRSSRESVRLWLHDTRLFRTGRPPFSEQGATGTIR